MANTLMELLVTIGADSAEFQKVLDSAQSQADQFGAGMQKTGKDLSKVGGAMTLGLTLPIAAFGASSIKSFMDSENAMADLEATIASTSGVAGITATEATDLASGLQKVTKFSDESIVTSEAMLLTFTNIGEDVFPQATEMTLNMAEKFGGLDAAAIQLGKALNDPVSGVTALRRVGVKLTEAQEEQIKKFMETNDIASAQKVILGELETEFGGLARAAGETTSGQFEQFKNQLDDVKETIGGALVPILVRLMEAVVPLIEKFAAMSPEQQNMILMFVGIVAAIGPVIAIVGGLVTGLGAIIPVLVSVAGALAPFILPILAVVAILALLWLAWKTNFGGIQEHFATFVAWITPIWDALWSGLTAIFEYFAAQAQTLFEAFSLLFQGDFEGFGEKLREAWDRMWAMVLTIATGAWNLIKTAFVNLSNNIITFWKNIDWANLGRNMIQGLINGIKSMISNVGNAAKSVASAVSDTISGFMKSHSPSKRMFDLGADVTQGFQNGIMATSKMLDIPKALNIEPHITGIPKSNNTATDNGSVRDASSNITINVQNPKLETAEDSIRKMLKNLSYLGVAT